MKSILRERAPASAGQGQCRGSSPGYSPPNPWRRFVPLLLCGMLTLVGKANPVQTVDLAGTWTFKPTSPSGNQTTIQVPGGGWKKQGFTCKEADYSRSIAIPNIGQPQVTKIKFGAVNYQADLFVNEVFVASSTQSHTAATFDITNFVTPGNTYTVRVHVKGHDALLTSSGRSLMPNGAGSWSPTLPDGIFRSAEVLVYPQVHIEDVFVKPSVTNANLSYDVWVRNASSSTANVTLSGGLTSWNSDSWSYPSLPSQAVSIPANTTTKVTVGSVAWNLGTTSYWWPNVPYVAGYTAKLHNLNLSISDGASHSTSVRFGFRECKQASDGPNSVVYLLNGTRVNFRGDSLQGANYDRIDVNGGQAGGQGNAYDTLPGFLPGANGWPKAVDNYQRLNYNVVRIHQIPASPYMLDVCDEKGLMIIDETGIRGAGDQQDFIQGRANMVNHVKQLFTRDRNHPSIVRLSISNEPDHSQTDSVDFQEALYAAAMSVDGTRPISIDAAWYDFQATSQYGGLDYDNFSVFRHYGTTNGMFGQYTDEVFPVTNRPYGSGEHIWDRDNTAQGFTWFATSTANMRLKNASDIRPYTLLSAWASVIPGVSTSQMQLENPPWNSTALYPLYGENNLANPWANAQIQRLQTACNPVLVADTACWESTKLSDANGAWPAAAPFVAPNTATTRSLTVFNDTFSGGTSVNVAWELRQTSPTGTLATSGSFTATVPYGYRTVQNISFTTPNVANGTKLFLVLIASKGGVELFRENAQYFTVGTAVLANGTYKLINRNSGKVLSAASGNGGAVTQEGNSGSNTRKWTLTNVGGNTYQVRNVANPRYLDVYGESLADGASITVWDYTAKNNQLWIIEPVGGGYYSLKAVHSNKALDVYQASGANGAAVVQWGYNGGFNQHWTIQAQ
jgi:hypothetical protein